MRNSLPSLIQRFPQVAILLLLALTFGPVVSAKTIYNTERWRDADGGGPIGTKPAYNQPYSGPQPIVYFMVAKEERMTSRAYSDFYALEDWSDYEEPAPGYKGERTDITVEEYIDHVLAAAADRAPSGYQTYVTRGPVNSRDTSNGIPRENIIPESFGLASGKTGQDYVPYATVRNVAGMIYRDDSFACDTSVEHPTYDSDHVEVRDANGDLVMATNADICFFLYVPRVKTSDGTEIGPFVGRAHVQDEVLGTGETEPAHQLTIETIKNGLAPHLPLKSEFKNRLNTNHEQNIFYRHGRYAIPHIQGNMALPHNGANVLFNRRKAERPYHHERYKYEVTTKKSSPIWVVIVVGVLTLGAGMAIGLAIGTALLVGAGAGIITALLLPNEEDSTTYTGQSSGAKGEWEQAFPNKIYAYLALQADDSADSEPIQKGNKNKIYPLVPMTHSSENERELLTGARSGAIPVEGDGGGSLKEVNFGYNDQGAPFPADTNVEYSASEFMTKVFPAHRWYQIMKIPAYSHGDPSLFGSGFGGGGAGSGLPATQPDCSAYSHSDASIKSAVDGLCSRMRPLIDDMNAYMSNAPWSDPDYIFGGDDGKKNVVKTTWIGSGASMTAGSRSFDMAASYKDFNNIMQNHRALIEELESNSTSGGSVRTEYREFFTKTKEGALLYDRLTMFDEAMQEVSKEHYYKKWFVDTGEPTTLETEVVSAYNDCAAETLANQDNCFNTRYGVPSGVLGTYYEIEDNPALQKAFQCYTAGPTCNSDDPGGGTQLLGFVTYLEDIMNPTTYSPQPFRQHMATSESCRTVGTTLMERADCMKGNIPAIKMGTAQTPKNQPARWPY